MATNNMLNTPEPFAVAAGGTGVTSVTIAPTASAWAGWDANKNLSANNFIFGYATTVTSASPVTLTVASAQQQYFTGSTAQTLTMPVASTLVVGQNWNIVNNSSAAITINSSGGNLILTLPAASETIVTCVTASGTSAASWVTSPAVSGSGTVNSGLINQLAWYAATGTAVSGLATANSGVLVTSAGGVPSISSTLPAFTTSSITFSPTTSGIVGTTTNDSASGGYVGEYVSSGKLQAASVSVTSGNSLSILSISLTAGDWDVRCQGVTDPASGTTTQRTFVGISTTNNTLPTAGAETNMTIESSGQAATNAVSYCVGPTRITVASGTTTVYMVMNVAFSVSTMKAYGFLAARRMR